MILFTLSRTMISLFLYVNIIYIFYDLEILRFYMSAIILSSVELSARYRSKIAIESYELQNKHQIIPRLVVILIGDFAPSQIYVAHKEKACRDVGIICDIYRHDSTITEAQLIRQIEQLNQDRSVHGILIQLPLPAHINVDHIIEKIDPNKDVDGFHPYNLGLLALGIPKLRACTPYGIMQLLQAYNIDVKSKDALMIGKSRIVGLPMSLELLMHQATVTICHSETRQLQNKIKNHEIIIVATGRRNLIAEESFMPHHTIIDVGIHRINSHICGDVDYHHAQRRVAAITPVPGGVGPMTITALLQNILTAIQLQKA